MKPVKEVGQPAHHIPAPPSGVDLSAEVHSQLVGQMIAGRLITTGPDLRKVVSLTGEARNARDHLLVAYEPWVRGVARRGQTDIHRAEDSSSEAVLRLTKWIAFYDPTCGVPLGAWLINGRIITGREVTEAGMASTTTPSERRALLAAGSPIPSNVPLDAPTGEGLTVGDSIPASYDSDPAVQFEREHLSPRVAAALAALTPVQYECLAAHLGLEGHQQQTMAQIASKRGITEVAVSRAIDRAKACLAVALTGITN